MVNPQGRLSPTYRNNEAEKEWTGESRRTENGGGGDVPPKAVTGPESPGENGRYSRNCHNA